MPNAMHDDKHVAIRVGKHGQEEKQQTHGKNTVGIAEYTRQGGQGSERKRKSERERNTERERARSVGAGPP